MFKPIIPGQLVSVDAVRGRDLVPSAKNLLQTKRRNDGFSTWDASGIFFELDGKRRETGDQPSAQTLVLLYAADLRFRLRWEIQPALAAGQTVVAAPYVETAVAFGLASGLARKWLSELFRFAPRAAVGYWVDGNPPASPSPHSGFLEFSRHALPNDFFDQFTAHFAALEERGKLRRFDL